MEKRRRSSGFTLIELIVTIAIIAVLSALIFPVFARARASAKQATGISNASQIGKAVGLYLGDNDSYFPYACAPDDKFNTCPGETKVDLPLVSEVLGNYTVSKNIWQDPLDNGIPKIKPEDYSEAVECELPGTNPSMFAKYGSSFSYRSDLATDHVAEPYELVDQFTKEVVDQSRVAFIYTSYGNWHGGPDTSSKKTIALFGDLHTKVSSLVSVHQQGVLRHKN